MQFLKLAVCLVLAFAIGAMACMPTAMQPPSQTVQSPKDNISASKINEALATMALQSSLPAGDYQIGPEDLLLITLYNLPEAEARVTPRTLTLRVSHQGSVTLPLVGQLKVAGLTVVGLEEVITKKYDKYMNNPQIGVLVMEYRQRVSVIGSVQKSGVFELSGPKTVIDILAMAGGVTDKAGTQVHIYRHGANSRESHVIDLLSLASNATLINANNANLITMPVQAGDVINVPAAGTFFVEGAVRNPGPFPLGRRYSLTQALATAGGVDREVYSSDITIFRRQDSLEMQNLSVNLDAIMAGSAVDPQIQADDVIVVPMSGAKYFVKRFIGHIVAGGISIGSFVPAISGS